MGRRLLRYVPVAVVVLLLAVAALAANANGPRLGTAAPHQIVPTAQPDPFPTNAIPPPRAHPTSSGVNVPIIVFVVVIALVYGAVMLYLMLALRDGLVFRRRDRREPAEEPHEPDAPTADEVRAAMERGLAELIDGDDPRAAVIACWLRLEAVAGSAGLDRRESDVPGDLVARMMRGIADGPRLTGPAERALRELADVYRRARYAPHAVGEADRVAARTALDRLIAELSLRPGVPS